MIATRVKQIWRTSWGQPSEKVWKVSCATCDIASIGGETEHIFEFKGDATAAAKAHRAWHRKGG